jgi:hypothetical protein
MDWIPYIASGAAVFISTLCAALGYRRTHAIIPRSLDAHTAALARIRRQNATLAARIRRLERAIPSVTGDPNGA